MIGLMMKPRVLAVFAVVALVSLGASTQQASANTSVSYDFNDPNQLVNSFDSFVQTGTVTPSNSGGIGNSGSVSVTPPANAVFASKAGYSLGPLGSTYSFSTFVQAAGSPGYGGMGFTSAKPVDGNASGNPYRPNDALGASVHGSGFVFHNGPLNITGSWSADNAGIQTIKKASNFALLNPAAPFNPPGSSPDSWFKIVLTITRVTADTFDMRLEVWPSNANGTLLDVNNPKEPDAIFSLLGAQNTALATAPTLKSYISFSGTRFSYLDNFEVTLAGGSSVIQENAPVVLTTGADAAADGTTEVEGEVTSEGGSTVSARGFVLSDSPEPTTSDTTIDVPGDVGEFSGTLCLDSGTHHVRAFATNTSGTSYGVTKTVTIANSSCGPAPLPEGGGAENTANGSPSSRTPSKGVGDASAQELTATGPELARTGPAGDFFWLGGLAGTAFIAAGITGLVAFRRNQLQP
jgi:hypothetical protein